MLKTELIFRLHQPKIYVSTEVGSLRNGDDVQKGIAIIKNGDMVAAQMRGVFGIWVRADDQDAVKRVQQAKNEDTEVKRSYTTMLGMHEFSTLVNLDLVHPSLREIMAKPQRLTYIAGSIIHFRAPVLSSRITELGIPDSILSQNNETLYLQNLCPTGHPPMANFIRRLRDNDIFPALTTLNTHTLPEVTTKKEGITACNQMGIGLLLLDELQAKQPDIKGSYTIVDAQSGSIVRDGNVPPEMIDKLLGFPLDRTNMKAAKYPQPRYPEIPSDWLPEHIRTAVILYSQGLTHKEIRKKIAKITERQEDSARC